MILTLYSIIANFGIIEHAIGYTLGLSTYKFIQTFYASIVIPLMDTFFKRDLSKVILTIGTTKLLVGKFVEALIDFIVVVASILFILRVLLADVIDDIILHKTGHITKSEDIKS